MSKRSKQYKEMMKKYKKIIMKGAKEAATCPWDYSFGLDLFVQFLRFMRDYYTNGENVWQVDECRIKVVETLNQALAEYDAWVTCNDVYCLGIAKDEPDYQEKYDKAIADGYYDLNDSSKAVFQSAVREVTFLYKYPTREETNAKLAEEYRAHRANFFRIVAENIENWWD